MNITFTIPYEGGREVRVDGETVGYIDRAMDGYGWTFEGRFFGLLAEAKATVKFELLEK